MDSHGHPNLPLSSQPDRDHARVRSRGVRQFSILSWAVAMALLLMVLVGSGESAQEASPDAARIAEAAAAKGVSVTPEQVRDAMKAKSSKSPSQSEQPTPDQTSEQPAVPSSQVQPGRSAIELLLAGQGPVDVNGVLKQFGYDVFQRPVSTFAPVTNVPVGPDYVVGPGDSFTVTTWGRQNDQIAVTVDRDGKIAMPEVGVLNVSGMTFGKLQDYLENELKRKFTDFKIAVTMGRLRTVTVYVIGEAHAPGSYTLSSLSTAITTLFAVGGPSKNGSLRQVRLLRAGQAPVKMDLYDFLLGGEMSRDVRLQDGDTIHIPLIGPVAGVAGNVKRPAIYEMAGPMKLKEVLDLAGGVTYAGWLQHVQVERVENHQRRIVVDFDLSQLANNAQRTTNNELATPINDGDLIKVFPVTGLEQNVVFLEGHVIRPGKYELKPGMRLGDLLGGDVFQPQVNMDYAEIERLVPPDFHPIVIPFNLGKVLQGDPSLNMAMSRFDRIRLFRWDEKAKRSVSISGMVYEPNEYRFIPGMRLTEIIDASGGLMKNTYLKTAELTRRYVTQDGLRTEKTEVDLEKALAGDPNHNVLLQDYDHLVVRPIPGLEFDRQAIISGEVNFPGTYPIRRGERLSSLIERAGGFTDKAYLKGAVFTRDSARIVQQQRLDDVVRQLEKSLLTSGSQTISTALDAEAAEMQKMTLQTRKELLTRLRAARIDGRVVIRLQPLDKFTGGRYDLELEKGDTLHVPETPGVVYVMGEVFNPAALLYESEGTLGYYLGRVGGATKEADRKELSVIRADGSVVSMAQRSSQQIAWDKDSHQWQFGNFMGIRLDPGDTIVVPTKLDKVPWLRTTKDITQIIFQIALAAGVVLAI